MVGRVVFNDDGEFIDSSEKFPTVCTPDGTLFIKAAEGTVIFHSDVNIDNSFIQRMSAALSELLNKYTKIRAYMQQYHTIFNGLYTNVKAKTNATDVISAGPSRSDKIALVTLCTNVHNEIKPSKGNLNRFRWNLINQEKFMFEIDHVYSCSVISEHLVSIFLDGGRLVRNKGSFPADRFVSGNRDLLLEKPGVVIESRLPTHISYLSKSDFVRFHHIVNGLDLFLLSDAYNHIAIEINKVWYDHYVTNSTNFRKTKKKKPAVKVASELDETSFIRLDSSKLFSATLTHDHKFIQVGSNSANNDGHDDEHHSVRIQLDGMIINSSEIVYDVCCVCGVAVYENNYVFVREAKSNNDLIDTNISTSTSRSANIDQTIIPTTSCILVCPLCAHAVNGLSDEYDYIFVVKYPRSIINAIDSTSHSAIKKDMLKEIANHGISRWMKGDRYVELGTKYLAVNSIDDYIFDKDESYVHDGVRKVCILLNNK